MARHALAHQREASFVRTKVMPCSSDEGNLVGLLVVHDLLATFVGLLIGALRLSIAVDGTTEHASNGEDDDDNNTGRATLEDALIAGLELSVRSISLILSSLIEGSLAELLTLLSELGTTLGVDVGKRQLLPLGVLSGTLLGIGSAIEESLDVLNLNLFISVSFINTLALLVFDNLNEFNTSIDMGGISVLKARLENSPLLLVFLLITRLGADLLIDVLLVITLSEHFRNSFLNGLLFLHLGHDLLDGGSVGSSGSDEGGNGSEFHV